MRRFNRLGVGVGAAGLAVVLAACGSGSSGGSPTGGGQSGGTAGLTVPTAGDPIPTSVGQGEGKLNIIAWEGYAQPQWVKPFEAATGCQVSAKYAGSSNEMVSLMAHGGGGQYDLVSASGDADLRLIYGGDVRPVNMNLIPQSKNFHSFLQAPGFNTIGGKHYGTSYEFGPNVLLYNTKDFSTAPTSWSVLYNKQYSGKITVPDNPIQIADAALYMSKTQPSLGITDPYELTQPQFNATVSLLKQQQPLIKKYWGLASQEITLFQSGTTIAGAAWPYQTNTLKVQAQQAIFFGETPANKLACVQMNKISKGSCAAYHANAPEAYYNTIKFWKTPLAQCGNGKTDCVPYLKWESAWTQITG
jgi:putative spermidine/putrescine transport system substrate-binding protein